MYKFKKGDKVKVSSKPKEGEDSIWSPEMKKDLLGCIGEIDWGEGEGDYLQYKITFEKEFIQSGYTRNFWNVEEKFLTLYSPKKKIG